MDFYFVKYDVFGLMVYIMMFESIGLFIKEELVQLLIELKDIYVFVERGEFVIEEGVEDVYLQVELMFMCCLGDVGKKIYSGCFCNDQVLFDLKFFICIQIREVVEVVE